MNIDEHQVAVALSEAFTCYLGVLTRLDAVRQSRIPSKGKSAETIADLSAEQDYRARITITELCMRFTTDLARDVFYWVSEPVEEIDDSREIEVTRADLFSKLESVTPDQPEELLINVFSGKPIEILTQISAGPSGASTKQDEKESREEVSPVNASEFQRISKERSEQKDHQQSRQSDVSKTTRFATLKAKEKDKEELFQRLSQPKSPKTKVPIRREAETTTAKQGALFRRLSQPKSRKIENALRRKTEPTPVRQKREIIQIECTSCLESATKWKVITLACNHTYCGRCLATAFQTALSSRTLFECCTTRVRSSVATSFLSASFHRSYTSLTLELTTVNPLFCASPTCSKFLPPSSIHGPFARCKHSGCNTKTCVLCRRKVHKGVCKEDQEGRKVKEMGEMNGWKTCPFCGHMVEKTEGCLHMTCQCKGEWCWSCRERWSRCRSTCNRQGEA